VKTIAALLALVLWTWPAVGAEQTPGRAQVVEEATATERRILDELDALERAIDAAETAQRRRKRQIAGLRGELAEKRKESGRLEQALAAQKGYLARRIRALYRLKEGGLVQLLVSADSLEDMLRRYRYFSAVIAHDERVLEAHRQRRLALDEAMARIRSREEELKILLARDEAEKEKLNQIRKKKTAVLMTVHERKETYLALEREREASREKLVKEVILTPVEQAGPPPAKEPAEEAKPRQWPDMDSLKGKLPSPVPGRLHDHFGRNPGRFGAYTTRLGVTIEAPAQSPVLPVAAGEIVYAAWLRGYGNVVIIDHGDRYYTLTAGLADVRVRPGQWVERSDALGLVPNSGKAEEKEIYLEIRLRGRALDPGQWLAPERSGRAEPREK